MSKYYLLHIFTVLAFLGFLSWLFISDQSESLTNRHIMKGIIRCKYYLLYIFTVLGLLGFLSWLVIGDQLDTPPNATRIVMQ